MFELHKKDLMSYLPTIEKSDRRQGSVYVLLFNFTLLNHFVLEIE